MDEADDGARVGLWVTLGIITLLLFSLIAGLAIRQAHKKGALAAQPQALASPVAVGEAVLDAPIAGPLMGKVYFDTGSAALPATAAAALDAVKLALVQAPPESKLVLSGFHDASGDPVKNAELAKERARAVRESLAADGVEPGRMSLRKPESVSASVPAEEARRVEIRLVN